MTAKVPEIKRIKLLIIALTDKKHKWSDIVSVGQTVIVY